MQAVDEVREILSHDPLRRKEELVEAINQFFASERIVKMCLDMQKPDYTCLGSFSAFTYKPALDEFLAMASIVYECLSKRILTQHNISNASRAIVDILKIEEIRSYIMNGVTGYARPEGMQFLLNVDFYNLGYVD